MHENLKYNLPEDDPQCRFISQLTDQFRIKDAPSRSEKLRFYDTFDWRLFNNSLVLYQSENTFYLRKLAHHEIIDHLELNAPPSFAWNFPESSLKERLVPILKMRALMRLAEIHCRTRPYHILNRDEKTVVRLVYEEIRPTRKKDAAALQTHLWLKPVRGYPKVATALAKALETAGLRVCKSEDLFFSAMAVANKTPGSYSAKVGIQLDPAMRSDEAAKVIMRFLLEVMQVNAAHLAQDLDTEFLHDFRVAIRRTRSALGQIKAIFPVRTTNRFKKDFALLGGLSNELRDLDVYLLNENTYKEMLPENLRNDIDPLFAHLRKKRSRAFQKVLRSLKTKKYARILQDWEKFLNLAQRADSSAVNAGLPVIVLARKRIFKRYRSIVKTGSRVLENTEDEMLHALRIECKKLRYLLEFFSSLFPRKKVDTLIGQLKKLQDNLGDFNDLCVQEEYLLNISRELPAARYETKMAQVAIGSLIGMLALKRKKVKDAFAKAFTDFTAPPNRQLFKKLFDSRIQKVAS